MALKDLLDKGKCLVGFHRGEWVFDTTGQCAQTRVCPICGVRNARVEHGWGEWTHRSLGSCELIHACQRCGDVETRTEHSWGDWQYVRENDCTQMQACMRCGTAGEQTQLLHAWEPWAYSEPHRAPVRRCERCSARVSRFARQSIDEGPPAAPAEAPVARRRATRRLKADDMPRPASEVGATTDSELMRLFASADTAAMVAFVERCPASALKGKVLEAMKGGFPEIQLLALSWLADPYCRGADPALGIAICEAAYAVAQQAFAGTKSPSYLTIVGHAAVTCLVGYASQGKHRDVIRFGQAASDWLKARGCDEKKLELLLHRIEAHLSLEQFDEAGALLDQAEKISISPEQPAESLRLKRLRHQFDSVARQRAMQLPPEQVSESDTFAAHYKDWLQQVQQLRTMVSGEMFDSLRAKLDALVADLENNVIKSPSDWEARIRSFKAELTDFLSGGAGGMNALRNRNRAIEAANIFRDPVKGRDPASIAASLVVLIEARSWAKRNNCADDENFALWSLFLCYSRTGQAEHAIDVLQALRSNLESRRSRIADPMERAGVLREYPLLFDELCHLLCHAGRAAELLDAMEGAKGRVLADVLTRQRGEAVPDSEFREPAEELTRILQATNAHYVSYFVGEAETYAVLVARDGSMRCQAIAIGREQLQELVELADPTTWSRPRGGFFAAPPTRLPDRLACLVQWLEPFVEAGTVRPGDHLCYCPDQQLHLVPLHYLPFRGEPLVRHFSISRIHSISAVVALLRQPAVIPVDFMAAQVPAKEDRDPGKVSMLARVPQWLTERRAGIALAREQATVDAVAKLDLTRRVVHFATHGTFPLRDSRERNPNPFQASGLALAKDGTLPSLARVAAGKADDTLLTPERVLNLRLDGSHVTLQACVSGLAKEGIGGDALGLELAFLLAGAQSMLTTHWNVSAAASADFSIRFYQKWLVDKLTRAQAWREAMLDLMKEETPSDLPGEYYWAGFSLSGDWR
jgi:tetratricopeptide (TPR) repeat protein